MRKPGILLLSLIATLLPGCASQEQENRLAEFTSDGCSLFPERSKITGNDWCNCCFEHDLAYWRGGTREAREQADNRFRQCIFDKTNNNGLANFMYQGVRYGGSPYFYTWYRWGYGWDYDRKYQALTEEEADLADTMARAYLSTESPPYCKQANN